MEPGANCEIYATFLTWKLGNVNYCNVLLWPQCTSSTIMSITQFHANLYNCINCNMHYAPTLLLPPLLKTVVLKHVGCISHRAIGIYRVSQEECARFREGVPYVKLYRYNPKNLCPNLNGYGDNGQRSLKLSQLLHTYWLPHTY